MPQPAEDAPTEGRGRADTRQRLLTAAAALFGAHGYERASLAQMARRAGLTTGAVYSQFGSKWELLRAVVAQQSRGLRFFPKPHPHGLRGDAELLGAHLHQVAAAPDSQQLLTLQLEILLLALRNPTLLDDVVTDSRAERTRLAQELRERALASGHRLPLPAEQLATLLAAAAQGLQLTQLLEPDVVPAGLYADALLLLLGRPSAPPEAPGGET
jgi:AcrR family transcriptional regulator